VQAIPGVMVKLHADPADQRAIKGSISKERIQMGSFPNKKKHGHAAEEIKRHEPPLGYGRVIGILVHNDHPLDCFPHLRTVGASSATNLLNYLLILKTLALERRKRWVTTPESAAQTGY
jgi:hypothetical protein